MTPEGIKQKITFYQNLGLVEKEKALLKEILLDWEKYPNWQEGILRMKKLDSSFVPALHPPKPCFSARQTIRSNITSF